jgi:hypothetical protein
MFEKYFSKRTSLPQECEWAERYFRTAKNTEPSLEVLDNLKQDKRLLALARELAIAEQELNDEAQQMLIDLFDKSLSSDPYLRTDNLSELAFYHSL